MPVLVTGTATILADLSSSGFGGRKFEETSFSLFVAALLWFPKGNANSKVPNHLEDTYYRFTRFSFF